MFEAVPLLGLPAFRKTAFSSAERLVRSYLPRSIRRLAARGTTHECPVCESKISGFRPFGHIHQAWCPVCGVMPWHRHAWLIFQRETPLFDGTPRKMLHVAPEPELARRLSSILGANYLAVDLDTRRPYVQERMDITDIQYPDQTFDLIFCSHVLEHVPDDRKAMREFYRVLRSGGLVLVFVPLQPHATVEDPTCTDPKERERRFGQFDHVRHYGPDIIDRLTDCGFQVRRLDARKMGLTPEEILRFHVYGGAFLCSKPTS